MTRTGLPPLRASLLALNPDLPPAAVASMRGAVSQAVGVAGERVVEVLHAAAREAGVACMTLVQTRVGETGGKILHLHKSTPDALGYLPASPGGRAVAVAEEIKATPVGAFKIRRVVHHQRVYLGALRAAGGLALLTLVWGEALRSLPRDPAPLLRGPSPAVRVYTLPWGAVPSAGELREEDAAAWRVTPATYLRDLGRYW